MSPLRFLVASYISDVSLKKRATQKGPNKSLISLSRGPGKGQPTKTENRYTGTAVIQLTTPGKSVVPPLSSSKGPVGHGGQDSSLLSPLGWHQRSSNREDHCPCTVVMSLHPIPATVSGDHLGNSTEALLPIPVRMLPVEAWRRSGTTTISQQ